ncbi:MAG: hypothetical protein H6729_11530 [Deltaproteobacteria bacterium]|nr:hypothetical protein [Deltaproteobacteria bacterium]
MMSLRCLDPTPKATRVLFALAFAGSGCCCFLGAAACGVDARDLETSGAAPNSRDDDSPGGGSALGCALDQDCPSGLICRNAQCLSQDDLRPPEVESTSIAARPIGTRDHLFALGQTSDRVLIIDPTDLTILPIPVPADPMQMAELKGREAVAVLSDEGRALSVVDATQPEPTLAIVPLPRRASALSVSPDGRFAAVYVPESIAPDDGAEGLVTFVRTEGLETTSNDSSSSSSSSSTLEVAAGYRITNIFYQTDNEGRAQRAVILSKNEATVVDLDRIESILSGTSTVTEYDDLGRLPLPDAFSDVIGREAVAIEASGLVLLRSFATSALAVINALDMTIQIIPLPSVATDLDVAPDGRFAALALRGAGEVALMPLPDAISAPETIAYVPISEVVAGQVEIAHDGRTLAVFSTQDDRERFLMLDVDTHGVRVYDRLQKKLRQVTLSPTSTTALVIHVPEPDSTVADPYERAVDKDEGYSIVDLRSGSTQLKRTATLVPESLVFSASSKFGAITLRDPTSSNHRVESINLGTLITRSFLLGAPPEFADAFRGEDDRFWITETHVAGRLGILDPTTNVLRTLTGYQLNAEIER